MAEEQTATAIPETEADKAASAARLAVLEKAPIRVDGAGAIRPDSLAGMYRVAEMAVRSGLVPVKTPEQAMLIMARGAELGFPGLTAFQFLFVIDGKPHLTPAGAKAKALASGLLRDFREEIVGEGEDRAGVVTVLRAGIASPIQRRFSVADARRAKLWEKVGRDSGKPSAWVLYPDRMLLARARGWAFQDAFPDLCGGLQVREADDLAPTEMVVLPTATHAPRPKTGADPILAKLGVKQAAPVDAEYISHADAEVREPFQSHAEADKAIADQDA